MLAYFHMCGIRIWLRAVLYIIVRHASTRGPMYLGASYLVCQDLVSCYFALFYCVLDLRSGECDAVLLYVHGFVCCVFGETIRNMFGCVCYFVVECYGLVMCGWRCSIG